MFAEFYNLLMEDIDYDVLYKTIKPYVHQDDFIIDAGCGTGYLLALLLENKHQAIGIDIDTDMLKIAKENLIKKALPQPLYEHDIRMRFGMKCDVIVSLFDVVHYFKGVKVVFKNIHQALEDHGRFVFDLYKPDIMKTYDGYVEEDNEPTKYHWSIKMKHQLLTHHICTDHQQYKIKQYLRPLSYYLDVLKETGFSKTEIIDSPDERKQIIIAFK
jgi:SAM-dependent methyltransferase